jgi:hypothetical protein
MSSKKSPAKKTSAKETEVKAPSSYAKKFGSSGNTGKPHETSAVRPWLPQISRALGLALGHFQGPPVLIKKRKGHSDVIPGSHFLAGAGASARQLLDFDFAKLGCKLSRMLL